jgi:hypothetical protein
MQIGIAFEDQNHRNLEGVLRVNMFYFRVFFRGRKRVFRFDCLQYRGVPPEADLLHNTVFSSLEKNTLHVSVKHLCNARGNRKHMECSIVLQYSANLEWGLCLTFHEDHRLKACS